MPESNSTWNMLVYSKRCSRVRHAQLPPNCTTAIHPQLFAQTCDDRRSRPRCVRKPSNLTATHWVWVGATVLTTHDLRRLNYLFSGKNMNFNATSLLRLAEFLALLQSRVPPIFACTVRTARRLVVFSVKFGVDMSKSFSFFSATLAIFLVSLLQFCRNVAKAQLHVLQCYFFLSNEHFLDAAKRHQAVISGQSIGFSIFDKLILLRNLCFEMCGCENFRKSRKSDQ